MKSTIKTKRATITIVERTPIYVKNDRVLFRRIQEFREAAALAFKNNDAQHIEMYKQEIQKHRKLLKKFREQRFVFEVTLKKPFSEKPYKLEAFYDHNTHSAVNWKKFIKMAEGQAIHQARLSLKHIPETGHKLGTHFTMRHGSKTKGFTYFTEGNILKAHVLKNIKKLYDGKTPEAPRRYIGIELEFCAPIKEDNFAVKLFQAGIHKFAQLKQDGSLRPKDKENGYELAILLEESNYKKGLKKIIDVLTSVKAVVKERRCGLHVHVDMRRRDKDLVYNNLVACQYALLSVVDPGRYNNEFCRTVDTRKFPTEFTGDRHERYKTINAAAYYKYKTLEVRMHEGSVSFKEISNWVDLILKITNYSKRLKDDVTKLSLLQRRVKLNKSLYNYALERSCTWQIQNNDHTRVMRQDITHQEQLREARLLRRDQMERRRAAPETPVRPDMAQRLRDAVTETQNMFRTNATWGDVATTFAIPVATPATGATLTYTMNTVQAPYAPETDVALRELMNLAPPELDLDNEPDFDDDETEQE